MNNNESSERLNMPDGMDRFSATGKAFKPIGKKDHGPMAWNSMHSADSLGAGPANLLPVKFTDDSMIDVAVMRPEDVGKAEMPKKKASFFSRRRSDNTNFVIRQMRRGDYLKHYAKDDSGRYCGQEEPASDCILRGEDIQKYRGHLVGGI